MTVPDAAAERLHALYVDELLRTLNSVIVGVNLAYEDGTHSRQARNVRNTHNGTNPRVAATIEWDDEVFVDTSGGTPYVVVRVGDNDRRASYVSGSGGKTLRFEYQLTTGDDDADSATLVADSLRVNGGTIRDADEMDVAVDHGDDSVAFPDEPETPDTPETPERTDPLTADFRSVPAEHNGTDSFELVLHLSENIADLSYQTLRDGAIDASGGSVTKVSRLNPPSNADGTVIENVEERMAARREPGVEVRVAGYDMFGETPAANGQPNALGVLGTHGRDPDNRGQGFDDQGLDPLATAAFQMNRAMEHGGTLSLWSRSTQSSFAGRDGALALNGQVQTRLFGADYAKGRMVMGLAVADTQGLGSYSRTAGGDIASGVTGLYPWLGYPATERVSFWTTGGYGAGSLRLTPAGGVPLEAGLSMGMAAAGARGELIGSGGEGFGLAIKSDVLWVTTSTEGVEQAGGRMAATEASVSRMRAGLESSRDTVLAGTVLTPSVEIALRHDGGDAETGFGIDLGGGLRFTDPRSGLAVDLRMRQVVIHEAAQFQERSLSLALSYDPTPSALGLNVRVTPTWGRDSGGNALWNAQPLGGMGGNPESGQGQLDTDAGYGLPVARFVGTPRLWHLFFCGADS